MVGFSDRFREHPQAACFALALLVATGPARAASEKVLYSFSGGGDGAYPVAGLIDVGGKLYGTTQAGGGSNNGGTVFEVTQAGAEKVLHSFQGAPTDGAAPLAGLIDVGGALYGTTSVGGNAGCGCGTVFKVTTKGAERVVYSFLGGSDGYDPQAGLVHVGGRLYGTTALGGSFSANCVTLLSSGCGTVFEVTQARAERVVYAFTGAPDGTNPAAGLLAVGRSLYGTTPAGGSGTYYGTVFEVTRGGRERVLHSFGGSGDGCYPKAGLVEVGNRFWGTTSNCGDGAYKAGTVFKMNKAGAEMPVYTFTKPPDGVIPMAGLIQVGDDFYGTTQAGGSASCDCGTVFKVTKAGRETVVYSFTGAPDGYYPVGGLIKVGGALYGTTIYGGSANDGTVFKVTP